MQIIKPVSEVFAYTINPKNSPNWIEPVVVEQTNEWPVKIGSIYKNQNTNGEWTEYVVTALVQDKLFELLSADGVLHVRYSYKPIADYKSEMEYFEWSEEGDIKEPFKQEYLNKLKRLVEGV